LRESQYDPSFFLQITYKGIVILLAYMDDIVVIGFDEEVVFIIKQLLHSTFHMKELSTQLLFRFRGAL